jgi:YD repeat-containing protein
MSRYSLLPIGMLVAIGCLSVSADAQTVTNVALASNGGVASASSTYSSAYPISAINNGDRKGLNWGNGGGWNDATSGSYPDWVQIDFAGSKAIREIDVFTLQNNFTNPIEPTLTTTFSQYGITAFDVQYWNGSGWVTVPGGSITGNNKVWRQFTFSDITTSKIRVLVNSALSSHSRITEVEAYQSTVWPTVTLTSPANNAAFSAPANITISADASDSDGIISKVEFFQGSFKLGETATSPFSFFWTNAAAGGYILTAKATDNAGAITTSSAVNVTVNADGSITGKVTRLDGTTAIAGAVVKLYQGASVIGTATTNATGDYTVGMLSAGTYSVEASAAGYETTSQTGVSVLAGATMTVNISLAVPISYVYDQLGRLVSVIDKDGNAATYSYDAVGNLLAISRPGPTQIAIMQFNPVSGPVGASVTIYGAGFSPTAGQNTVAFNGVSATVISSSTNLIVTSVPAGATTGTIAVTSPAGSATSAGSFSVSTGAPGLPTIAGFTPSIGPSGTPFTITGTNFDANTSKDKVVLNATLALPSSATSTNIATSVPSGAGSGRISISTPSGKAVSSADFFCSS